MVLGACLAAIALLVEDVSAVYSSVSGVTGPTAGAEAFSHAWIARHGGRAADFCRVVTQRWAALVRAARYLRVSPEGGAAASAGAASG